MVAHHNLGHPDWKVTWALPQVPAQPGPLTLFLPSSCRWAAEPEPRAVGGGEGGEPRPRRLPLGSVPPLLRSPPPLSAGRARSCAPAPPPPPCPSGAPWSSPCRPEEPRRRCPGQRCSRDSSPTRRSPRRSWTRLSRSVGPWPVACWIGFFWSPCASNRAGSACTVRT